MKRVMKTIVWITCMVLFIKMSVIADGSAMLMEVQGQGDIPAIYVKGVDGEIETVDVMVGNADGSSVTYQSLEKDNVPLDTLILIDNSLSIPESSREDVLSIVSEMVAARSTNERYAIATYGEDLETVVDWTNDYTQLKAAIDTIEFSDRETYLTDVLYNLISTVGFAQTEDGAYRRIFVVSDGVDNKSIGYTSAELSELLRKSGVPIYSLGVYNKGKSNNEELKNMFALSRQTNAESFLLEEVENPLDIVTQLSKDREIVRFVVELEDEVKDGGEKTITLKIKTSEENVAVVADQVRMPQVVIQEVEEEEAEPVLVEEPLPEPEPEPELSFFEQHKKTIVIVASAAIAWIILIVAVILLIAHAKKKKKENEIIEVENPFTDLPMEEEKTELVINSPRTDDGSTVYIFDQGRNYIVTLTDVKMPARTYQKAIQQQLVIGRSATKTDICIDYDTSVSLTHCLIERRGDSFFLKDLQASNGTYLDGNRVLSEVEISSGSILKMGRVEMRVEVR